MSVLFFQASHLETETISYEEKEIQLVNDCVKELREYWTDWSHIKLNVISHFLNAVSQQRGIFLQKILTFDKHLLLFPGDANVQISSLAEELARKTEDASRQQEEITHLLSQIVDLQKKAKMV